MLRVASLILLAALASVATAQDAAPPSGRMDFDGRVVKGERAAGAVVLYNRAPRALPGLVPMRSDFRTWILEPAPIRSRVFSRTVATIWRTGAGPAWRVVDDGVE